MQRTTQAGVVSLVTAAFLGSLVWSFLPSDPIAVAPYVPLVLAVAVVAGFLVVHGDRLTDRPRVTGPGPDTGPGDR